MTVDSRPYEIATTPRFDQIEKTARAAVARRPNTGIVYAGLKPSKVGVLPRRRGPRSESDASSPAEFLAGEAGRVAQRVREAILVAPEIVGDDTPHNRELIESLDRYFTDEERAVVQEDERIQDLSHPPNAYAYHEYGPDRVHFTSHFLRASEFQKVVTIIHEALHGRGGRFSQIEQKLIAEAGGWDNWNASNPKWAAFEAMVENEALKVARLIAPHIDAIKMSPSDPRVRSKPERLRTRESDFTPKTWLDYHRPE